MQSVLAGSQAVQASKQLAFSRDMEREADAVGFVLMKEAQYDGTDMVRMLRRLGAASSLNETGTVYARSHPGATERMANIEGRLKIGSTSVSSDNQTVNLNFLLVQARLRALLAKSPEGADDAAARFQFQLTAAAAAGAPTAGQRLAAHYGLALLAMQKKQPLLAAQHLAQAREFAITHPWLDVLDFEITSLATTKSALNLAAFINRQGLSGAAASLEAILLAQRNQSMLPSDSVGAAQSFLQQWLSSHPQDDLAWGALAAIYTQQGQAAMAAWAQAEQTAAMGVWASSISLLTTALRSGETTVPVATQNQWRSRLQDLRQIVLDEKTLLDKFK
jgi:predicted Zn-dependent protease